MQFCFVRFCFVWNLILYSIFLRPLWYTEALQKVYRAKNSRYLNFQLVLKVNLKLLRYIKVFIGSVCRTKCNCSYSFLQPDSPTDVKFVTLYLHMLVTFTDTATWNLLKMPGGMQFMRSDKFVHRHLFSKTKHWGSLHKICEAPWLSGSALASGAKGPRSKSAQGQKNIMLHVLFTWAMNFAHICCTRPRWIKWVPA